MCEPGRDFGVLAVEDDDDEEWLGPGLGLGPPEPGFILVV